MNIFRRLHNWKYMYSQSVIKSLHLEERLTLDQRSTQLTQFALQSTIPGVSSEKLCDEEVIVSLTTYGPRYYDSYLAIESIMQGTVKPNRIILWVSEELENEPIPILLQNQMKRGLEIRYRRDIRSYTKLLYALKEFPEAVIITVDDDIIYLYDIVENLVNTHIAKPGCICANVFRLIPNNLKTSFTSFSQWSDIQGYKSESNQFIFEGYSGVLYPPNALDKEVFNEDIFMEICKYADDVWFSAMAMLHGTKVACSYPHLPPYRYIDNDNVQSVGLKNINNYGEGLNDKQIHAVFSKYKLCGF